MPMVNPMTGKSISSYKHLMHNPATSEMWQTTLGKDFGGMAQGNNETRQKGTNSIFVMTHDKGKRIPKNQTVLSISVHKKQTHIIFKSQLGGISSTTLANCLRLQQTLPHPK
jgi:hypothetical protein